MSDEAIISTLVQGLQKGNGRLLRLLLQNISNVSLSAVCAKAQTPPTPKVQIPANVQIPAQQHGDTTPPVMRTNSSSSFASMSSVSSISSTGEESQLPEDQEEYDELVGDKKFSAKDKIAVRRPIMQQLDAMYLAPKVSPLFRRKFKNKLEGGKKVLKKNPDIDEKFFRKLVRHTLRRLVGAARSRKQDVYERYYQAAFALVKKRRANHIFNWSKNFKHKQLIYGGQDAYTARYGTRWQKTKKQADPTTPKSSDKVPNREPPTTSKKTPPSTGTPKAKITKQLFPASTFADLPDFEPEPESQVDPDETEEEDLPEETCVCADCGVTIKMFEAFPQNDGWSGCDPNEAKRCTTCFDIYAKKVLLPKVGGRRRQSKKTKTQPKKSTKKRKAQNQSKVQPTNKRARTPAQSLATASSSPPKTKKNKVQPVDTASPSQLRPQTPTSIHGKPVVDKNSAPPDWRKRERVVKLVTYPLGANVIAKFAAKQWYLAHVIKRRGTLHDVYFPGDGIVKENLSPKELRPADPKLPTRRGTLGKIFRFDGARDMPTGVWRVRQVLGTNCFRCTLVQGRGKQTTEDFEIGYVMRCIKEQEKEQLLLDLGPRRLRRR